MLDYGFRQYDAAINRFHTVDPLAEEYSSQNPYAYAANNPVIFIDFLGLGPTSTHTDKDGNVVAVYDDGDLGVYRHDDVSTREDVSKKRDQSGTTSGGGDKMGETYFWDEFVNFNTGKEEGRIIFGASWDSDLKEIHAQASGENLYTVMQKSKLHGDYDIKNDTDLAPHGTMTGKMLGGKYVSARSAGNYLAGWNGTTANRGIPRLTYNGYMIAAGYYNATGKISLAMLANAALGQSPYPAPTYGEDLYSARWISRGAQQNMNSTFLRSASSATILNSKSAINGYYTSKGLQSYFKR